MIVGLYRTVARVGEPLIRLYLKRRIKRGREQFRARYQDAGGDRENGQRSAHLQVVPESDFDLMPRALDNVEACVTRLGAIGRYVYNWSPGESYAWASPRWLDKDALMASLSGAEAQRRSGDVYAWLAAEDV